jgi:hypothetical protein
MVTPHCLNVDSRHITLYLQRALLLAHNQHERKIVMTRMKHTEVCLFVFMVTAGGTAFATCPNTMPLELLTDCIVYEGDGSSSFPTGDYAYMDRYQNWLKMQPQGTILPPNTTGFPTSK